MQSQLSWLTELPWLIHFGACARMPARQFSRRFEMSGNVILSELSRPQLLSGTLNPGTKAHPLPQLIGKWFKQEPLQLLPQIANIDVMLNIS